LSERLCSYAMALVWVRRGWLVGQCTKAHGSPPGLPLITLIAHLHPHPRPSPSCHHSHLIMPVVSAIKPWLSLVLSRPHALIPSHGLMADTTHPPLCLHTINTIHGHLLTPSPSNHHSHHHDIITTDDQCLPPPVGPSTNCGQTIMSEKPLIDSGEQRT